MKQSILISATALALISGGVMADTAATPKTTATPKASMSLGEDIADWFGNIATRVRALEQQHAGTRLEDLQKRVAALETEIEQLKSQAAQAETDAQKAQQKADEMESAKKTTANRHASQR